MPKRFYNDDTMVWIFWRFKTQTWKFMCGSLLGKRIVCSASKVTTCASVCQTYQVVVNSNSMLRQQQGDNTLIIYQSCHAIVKQDDSHYKWLTLLWFYLRIWLSPSWILPSAANAFLVLASVAKNSYVENDEMTVTFSSTTPVDTFSIVRP